VIFFLKRLSLPGAGNIDSVEKLFGIALHLDAGGLLWLPLGHAEIRNAFEHLMIVNRPDVTHLSLMSFIRPLELQQEKSNWIRRKLKLTLHACHLKDFNQLMISDTICRRVTS
jgi:hypothetical protein